MSARDNTDDSTDLTPSDAAQRLRKAAEVYDEIGWTNNPVLESRVEMMANSLRNDAEKVASLPSLDANRGESRDD